MKTRVVRTATVLALAIAVAVPAALAAQAKKRPVKTGPGVTAKTITLGIITDLSNVFASQGKTHVHAAVAFWAEKNRAGGVCGRQVKLYVKDNNNSAQQSASAYQQIQPKVLALQNVLGSASQAALSPLIASDHVVMGVIGWSSSNLKNGFTVTTGATYDIQMIDALQYLLNTRKLHSGDKVGLIRFPGDFGNNAERGLSYGAEKLGLSYPSSASFTINPASGDMSSQVSSLRAQGVKAIFTAASQTQLVGIANAEKALNLDVPIVGTPPTWVPANLQSAAADQLKKQYYLSTPIAAFTQKSKAVKHVAGIMSRLGIQDSQALYAWAVADMFYRGLKSACARRDLTRDGFIRAIHSIHNVTNGLTTPLTYYVRRPSGESVYIQRAADVPGGLRTVAGPIKSSAVAGYTFP